MVTVPLPLRRVPYTTHSVKLSSAVAQLPLNLTERLLTRQLKNLPTGASQEEHQTEVHIHLNVVALTTSVDDLMMASPVAPNSPTAVDPPSQQATSPTA